MSLNNSSTYDDSVCPDREWYTRTGRLANFIIYYIWSPFYIFLALFIRGLFLKAFYVISKKESAYVYQIYTTLSETFEVLAMAAYVLTFKLGAGIGGVESEPSWYRSCYFCMHFSAHIGSCILSSSVTMSELFTISMSADRMYALWKPTRYNAADHKRNQKLILLFCIGLAISTSLPACLVFSVDTLQNDDNEHRMVYQLRGSTSPLFGGLILLRSAVHALGLILLYFFNMALVYFYRVRVVAASKALNLTAEEKKRKESEKTLTLLTACQCFWMTLLMTRLTCFFILVTFDHEFYTCSGLFYVPLQDFIHQFIDLCDLVSVLMINQKIRKAILEVFPCYKGPNHVDVVPLQQQATIVVHHVNNVRVEASEYVGIVT